MSNVEEVRRRLLWEWLIEVFRQALERRAATLPDGLSPDESDETLLRLSGVVMALLEWHVTDGNGRCRVRGCSRRGWAPWRRRRLCRVFSTTRFWTGQPIGIVEQMGRRW